ncbi:MAG TPA: heat-inducible transcriptional repressor HrcA [Aquiluna sp.]
MIPERSLDVLRAIVQDFISSNQPVGSKALLDRHPMGVSAATIRNDMALLEEEELITAPHTSSGRIPTEKGYRLFVDQLGEVKPLSQAERNAIESFLVGANDLDDVVERTARSLSQLTNALSLVQYPSLGKSAVRHIELLPLSQTRVLLMLITDNGRVQQVQIECQADLDDELVQEIRGRLNGMLAGSQLSEVQGVLDDLAQQFALERREFVDRVVSSLMSLVDANRQEKLVISGASNLIRQDVDFSGELSKVLEAIEEQVVLMKLLDELHLDAHGVGLRIGSELGMQGITNTSVVFTGYESKGTEVAKLGILGPTRMDYSNNIASVRAVARYLSKVLEDN